MKRSLELLAEPVATRIAPVRTVELGSTRVAVSDDGDGAEALRFAGWLVDAGGTLIDDAFRSPDSATLRIFVRTLRSATHAARSLDTDVVLGSARPEFARGLARSILGDR